MDYANRFDLDDGTTCIVAYSKRPSSTYGATTTGVLWASPTQSTAGHTMAELEVESSKSLASRASRFNAVLDGLRSSKSLKTPAS